LVTAAAASEVVTEDIVLFYDFCFWVALNPHVILLARSPTRQVTEDGRRKVQIAHTCFILNLVGYDECIVRNVGWEWMEFALIFGGNLFRKRFPPEA
jgi:hypothetical protein